MIFTHVHKRRHRRSRPRRLRRCRCLRTPLRCAQRHHYVAALRRRYVAMPLRASPADMFAMPFTRYADAAMSSIVAARALQRAVAMIRCRATVTGAARAKARRACCHAAAFAAFAARHHAQECCWRARYRKRQRREALRVCVRSARCAVARVGSTQQAR